MKKDVFDKLNVLLKKLPGASAFIRLDKKKIGNGILGSRHPQPTVTLKEVIVDKKEPIAEGMPDMPENRNVSIWSQTMPGGFPSQLITERDIKDA